jgi:ADP-ribosylglycohydrolase
MANGNINLAQLSLEGLALGDAFGELFFFRSPQKTTFEDIEGENWYWTDDTHMALSIFEILKYHGRIDQDVLAKTFAKRYRDDPFRGYGGGAARLLKAIGQGADWRTEAATLFGSGSYGNGAAMRVAPVGGYFHEDFNRAANEAALSATVTHAHPEGKAGAIAVAVVAAIATQRPYPQENEFIRTVLDFVPESITRERMKLSLTIPPGDLKEAIMKLGTGMNVSAQDTVPFCIWTAAYHLDDYKRALWETVKGHGDSDTTSAIVGGIVALSAPELPLEWLKRREPLPVV